MDPVERRLEKLDSEISNLTAKTEAAWDAFISATDPQRKTELKERYIVLNKEKEDCRSEQQDLQLKLPSSGPAESSVWDKHGRCEQLASFLAALPAAQAAIENPRAKTVIGLEGGAIWLGMSTVATADLFVRNCYLELFEARESYIKAANWEHGCQIVFTGTPGVGKSHAAALFVAQKLLAGLCVLLETCWPGRESQRQYFWLSLSGKVERTVNTDAAGVRLNENKGRAIYVTDGCVPCISLALYDGHNVTFCSPQRDLWRRERKALPFKGFYVPVLNEDEVLAMKAALPHYKDLTDDSVSEWFSWAGGSARACLKINKDCGSAGLAAWTSDIKDLLGNISTDGLLAMIRCDGLDTYVESSDRIFHWVLAEGLSEPKACSPQAFRLRRYTKKCVRFASRKIKDLALITLDLSKLADVALACLDDSQQSTGYWVELLSFRCLQGGCKLHGAMLPERHTEGRIPFQISLPPATVEHWTIPMEAAQQSKSDLSVLCLPHSKNEPAIDAISGPALYWQMTKAGRHSLVRSALVMNTATEGEGGGRQVQLTALQQRMTWPGASMKLTKPLLCFMVPPQRFHSKYKSRQHYTTEGGIRHDTQSEVVHQCVVMLPLHDIMSESRNVLAKKRLVEQVETLAEESFPGAMEICDGDGEPAGRSSAPKLEAPLRRERAQQGMPNKAE